MVVDDTATMILYNLYGAQTRGVLAVPLLLYSDSLLLAWGGATDCARHSSLSAPRSVTSH